MFSIGEKVICIDDSLDWSSVLSGCDLDGLIKGEMYHIRWVGYLDEILAKRHLVNYKPEVYFVRLVEIKRGTIGGEEAPYYSWRFAPIIKKSTNIETFKKLTRPKTKVKELV